MTDNFKIDLNNPEQFPVLHSIRYYLERFTPHDLLDGYSKKRYDPTPFMGIVAENIVPIEEALNDVERIIAEFTAIKFNMRIAEQDYDSHLKKLIDERDKRFVNNIPGNDQRDFNTKIYNRCVVEEVEKYCNYIEFNLRGIFSPYFKEPEAEKLNIRNAFENWYEKFGESDEEIENKKIGPELKQSGKTTKKKLKWMGTPSQFGFIIDLLTEGGYLQKPTGSFAKDAELYFSIFEIETTESTLTKELSETTNSLNTVNRKKFTIPSKDELSG
jgi:hypothetical protein